MSKPAQIRLIEQNRRPALALGESVYRIPYGENLVFKAQ
jgi:hypothetical protein